MAQNPFSASSTIQPSVMVAIDSTTAGNEVTTASATNVPVIGISQESGKYAPILNAGTQAADAGDAIMVYQEGDICLLNATSAGWTNGDLLAPSTASSTLGYGVTASIGSGKNCGAIALETVTGTGLYKVKVVQRTA